MSEVQINETDERVESQQQPAGQEQHQEQQVGAKLLEQALEETKATPTAAEQSESEQRQQQQQEDVAAGEAAEEANAATNGSDEHQEQPQPQPLPQQPQEQREDEPVPQTLATAQQQEEQEEDEEDEDEGAKQKPDSEEQQPESEEREHVTQPKAPPNEVEASGAATTEEVKPQSESQPQEKGEEEKKKQVRHVHLSDDGARKQDEKKADQGKEEETETHMRARASSVVVTTNPHHHHHQQHAAAAAATPTPPSTAPTMHQQSPFSSSATPQKKERKPIIIKRDTLFGNSAVPLDVVLAPHLVVCEDWDKSFRHRLATVHSRNKVPKLRSVYDEKNEILRKDLHDRLERGEQKEKSRLAALELHARMLQDRKHQETIEQCKIYHTAIVAHKFASRLKKRLEVHNSYVFLRLRFGPMLHRKLLAMRRHKEVRRYSDERLANNPRPSPALLAQMRGEFFKEWSVAELQHLVDRMFHKSYRAGDIIMFDEDFDRVLYILNVGSVEIWIRNKKLLTKKRSRANALDVFAVPAPAYFGEFALLCKEPRSASIRCTTDCDLWVISHESFSDALQHLTPQICRTLEIATDKRRRQNLKKYFPLRVEVLKRQYFFSSWSMDALTQIAQTGLEPHVLRADTVIYKEGEYDPQLYFVGEGTVRLFRPSDNPSAAASASDVLVSMGECFGETEAFFMNQSRSYTAVCLSNCDVWSIRREALTDIGMLYSVESLLEAKTTIVKKLSDHNNDSRAKDVPGFVAQDPYLAYSLPSNYLSWLWQQHTNPHLYVGGDVICREGDEARSIFVVLGGSFSVSYHNPDLRCYNDEIIVNSYQHGQMVNLGSSNGSLGQPNNVGTATLDFWMRFHQANLNTLAAAGHAPPPGSSSSVKRLGPVTITPQQMRACSVASGSIGGTGASAGASGSLKAAANLMMLASAVHGQGNSSLLADGAAAALGSTTSAGHHPPQQQQQQQQQQHRSPPHGAASAVAVAPSPVFSHHSAGDQQIGGSSSDIGLVLGSYELATCSPQYASTVKATTICTVLVMDREALEAKLPEHVSDALVHPASIDLVKESTHQRRLGTLVDEGAALHLSPATATHHVGHANISPTKQMQESHRRSRGAQQQALLSSPLTPLSPSLSSPTGGFSGGNGGGGGGSMTVVPSGGKLVPLKNRAPSSLMPLSLPSGGGGARGSLSPKAALLIGEGVSPKTLKKRIGDLEKKKKKKKQQQ